MNELTNAVKDLTPVIGVSVPVEDLATAVSALRHVTGLESLTDALHGLLSGTQASVTFSLAPTTEKDDEEAAAGS